MNLDRIRQLFPRASADTLRLNTEPSVVATKPEEKSMIRQSHKRASKLQQDFTEHLRRLNSGGANFILEEALTLVLANGCRYTPDAWVIEMRGTQEHLLTSLNAYEVKGPKAWDDSIVKLKFAPRAFPWIKFFLATRPQRFGAWRIDRIES